MAAFEWSALRQESNSLAWTLALPQPGGVAKQSNSWHAGRLLHPLVGVSTPIEQPAGGTANVSDSHDRVAVACVAGVYDAP